MPSRKIGMKLPAYEFMEFYDLSKVNYIWFSEEGSFRKLQELVGKEPKEDLLSSHKRTRS